MAVTIRGSGNIVVATNTAISTTTFQTTSASYVDVPGLSVSITPTSSSNRVLIMVYVTSAADNNGNTCPFVLLRNSTQIALSTETVNTSNVATIMSTYGSGTWTSFDCILSQGITVLDTPNTTSTVTYKIQTKSTSTARTNINGRSIGDVPVAGGSSSITLMEMAYV